MANLRDILSRARKGTVARHGWKSSAKPSHGKPTGHHSLQGDILKKAAENYKQANSGFSGAFKSIERSVENSLGSFTLPILAIGTILLLRG